MMLRAFACGIVVIGVCVSSASATMLNAAMTVDNAFSAYTSTSDSVPGTLFLSGNNWGATYYGSATLANGVTNYLHIYGEDYGVIAAFIGQFTLSDGSFAFGNSTSTLLTNTSEWVVSATTFGSNYSAPTDFGVNGSSPWGTRTGISAAARWIWRAANPSSPAYFSAPIYYVPEPAGLAAFLVGGTILCTRSGRGRTRPSAV
jgi:hypothetical protein